jgi:hypothetical protein
MQIADLFVVVFVVVPVAELLRGGLNDQRRLLLGGAIETLGFALVCG